MDISFTNVLEGARQYFQGVPASNSTNDLDRLQSAKQRENDGSVRSEQQTAVPVFWEHQQTESQAAAMSTTQPHLHVPSYQAHIATVPVGGSSGVKTYHELQTSRTNAMLNFQRSPYFAPPAAAASSTSSPSTDCGYLYPPAPIRRHLPVQPSNVYNRSSSTATTTATTAVYAFYAKPKRESPLDLSVKTVRTSADSTFGGEHDERIRVQQQYSARAPKVDFLPNFAMQQTAASSSSPNNYYNYSHATSALPKVDFDFQQRKRTLEHVAAGSSSSSTSEKMPKVDMWRQNIDRQIDERFNSYQAARMQAQKTSTTTTMLNGTARGQPHQQQQLYPQSPYAFYHSIGPPRQPTKVELNRPQANKKVLTLLRTSLQNKGQQQQQQHQAVRKPVAVAAARTYREVLQPSTDVMAPLQPKPGSVGRRNVSPFTAASLERNSNTPPTYKFHIPKAIDSVIISDDGEKPPQQQEVVAAADLDGLAAFLAARIRTKAELKQVTGSSSPPPALKQESAAMTPATPKKLFARNEMKRAEVRSSSETSVFDFPDSDNETEMPVLDRQSLVGMRKDRRVKNKEEERVASPFSMLFQQTCDSFVEQLKRGNGKKRGRRKKEGIPDALQKQPSANAASSDSDTPLVHIASKQKRKMCKPKKELSSDDSEVEETFSRKQQAKADFYERMKSPIAICKPGKKPTFGDGSDFRPGWEEALYRYKKAIRIPMQLIQVTRPPSSQRLSTSLPDLDPCHMSPAPKTTLDSLDSDLDSSNCSFNFAKLTAANYDSDQGSMKSYSSKSSILDKLLERIGPMRKRRQHQPPPIVQANKRMACQKQKVAKFKDDLRMRTETRVLKEKATIREVFGEDRPASAPPVTCVDELKTDEPVVVTAKGGKENQQQRKKAHFNEVRIKKEDDEDRLTVISVDSVETVSSGRRRSKLRRKFSSGFDYIRKKKKQIKKEDGDESEVTARAKRRGAPSKATPESVGDIQREIKQWVLNKGVGETHLHRASRCGYTDITAYCLEKMSSHPSPKDNAGYTPLHEACAKGHLDIARLLLQYGAQVSESAQGGIRPLHEAAENGFIEIVRLLLSYGADPSLATYAGLTPLQLASDDATVTLIQQHLDEVQGKPDIAPWQFNGPSHTFDAQIDGYNPLQDVPDADEVSSVDDIVFEASEYLLPNLYALPDGDVDDRWMLLQDLANALKIKSKETLLRQLDLLPTSPSTAKRDHLREMKMSEFLERAHCCQLMHANEKLNARASKIFLVKYTDKVKALLNVEHVSVSNGR